MATSQPSITNRFSGWRVFVKQVAVSDLIFSILYCGLTTLIIGLQRTEGYSIDTNNEAARPSFWWFSATFLVFYSSIPLWAAVQLLGAIEMGREIKDAIKLSRYWEVGCILYMFLNSVLYLRNGFYVTFVMQLLFRTVLLCVVQRYVQELKAVANNCIHPLRYMDQSRRA